jgi:hypothetical protein
MRSTATINSGCTPNYQITLDFDENPNGNPVLWMHVCSGSKTWVSVPLDKRAVGLLLVEFSQQIGEM